MITITLLLILFDTAINGKKEVEEFRDGINTLKKNGESLEKKITITRYINNHIFK